MAQRHTESEDIQKDHHDSSELDLSNCTGSYQESNPTPSSSFGSDWESLDPPMNDVNMACIDDGSSSTDGEEPMSSTQTAPLRDGKQEMDEADGASDHQNEGDHSSEKEISDADEKSRAARQAKKKRGKAKAVKEKDRGSEHFSSEGRHEGFSDDDESNAASLAKKKRGKKQRTAPGNVKREWNEAEKAALQRQFGSFVIQRRIPRKEHCLKCLKEEKDLSGRSWKEIKNCVYKTVIALNRRSASRRLYF